MFYLLKFMYTMEDDNDIFVLVVLNQEQCDIFFENKGGNENFTYPYSICNGSDEADDDDNCAFIESKVIDYDLSEEVQTFLSDKTMKEIVLDWIAKHDKPYCQMTFIGIRSMINGRSSCCEEAVPMFSDKTITLDKSRYYKFREQGGEDILFSPANNHTYCPKKHSIFLSWSFSSFERTDEATHENDDLPLQQAVESWLNA